MMIPNLYTWGNAWLFHQKYIHFKLVVWVSRNPEPIENLSTPPVEKDQLRVDLSSNPAGFWIPKILPVENWKQVLCTAHSKPQKKTWCPWASKKRIQCSRWHPYSSLKASLSFLTRLHKDSKRRVFRIAWCLWSPQRNQRLPKHWTLRRGVFFSRSNGYLDPIAWLASSWVSNNKQSVKIIDARKNVGIMWDFSNKKFFVLEASFTTNRLIAQRIFLQHSLLSGPRVQGSPGPRYADMQHACLQITSAISRISVAYQSMGPRSRIYRKRKLKLWINILSGQLEKLSSTANSSCHPFLGHKASGIRSSCLLITP